MAVGRLDVVGVGALNVDLVVDVAGGGWRLRDDETAVGADEMGRLLTGVAGLPRRIALGGSAFNTVVGAARQSPSLRLGFVGVQGAVPFGEMAFRERLRALRVDVAGLGTSSARAGVCLALEDRDVRSLRIAPGANSGMAEHLADGAVAAYLARARVVHVTSFLDERTPRALDNVLADLRTREVRPLICLDPGHDWCARPDDAVRSLVSMADLVLVNEREYADLRRASDLGTCTVVVKGRGCATVHRGGKSVQFDGSSAPLTPGEIRRPTGAGDAFAAGLLATLTEQGAGIFDRIADVAGLAGPARAGLTAARAHLVSSDAL